MIKLTIKELLKMSPQDLSGKIISFATDTVFGVGLMYDENFKASEEKIYQMKERDINKPLAILTSSFDDVKEHLLLTDEILQITKYWPGALTIIFKTKDNYFDNLTSNHSVGVRIPNSKCALSILKHLGMMAVTSVNISGEAPLNDAISIEQAFSPYIDYLVTDEESSSNTSSTVIDARNTPYQVLRQGDLKIK